MKNETAGRRAGYSEATKPELVEHLFLHLTTDEDLFERARKMAAQMIDSHLSITLADLTAGKKYLLACLRNMDTLELRALGDVEGASLWARGAAGACRYRASGAEPRKPKSTRS